MPAVEEGSNLAGFRILRRRHCVARELVAAFRDIPVSNISDAMTRMSGFGAGLRPYHAVGGLCGPAFTVKVRPGDNLMVHAGLRMASAGDVLVVDAGADVTNAIVGERMIVRMQARGLAGLVVNGAIRDVEWVGSNDFPVFAAGVHHRGPFKSGPGEINVPLAIGGQVIEPGDLIVGDADGVICVPREDAERVYPIAKAISDSERATFARIRDDDAEEQLRVLLADLKKMGCYIEDEQADWPFSGGES